MIPFRHALGKIFTVLLGFFVWGATVIAEPMLIPMDARQNDHLKAYGVAYHALELGGTVEWLLNYNGGSFLLDAGRSLREYALVRGVTFTTPEPSELAEIDDIIQNANMSRELLEEAPKIAVYTTPNTQPWDDAVTLALTYAEIPYDTLWDPEVLSGKLGEYDWLHLHHEDFTGQYGKFYRSYGHTAWYIQQKAEYEAVARTLGFDKVSREKSAVAETIRQYVADGGFLFAMCSATDTIDIALAGFGIDYVGPEFDGDGFDAGYQQKFDYTRTFAFEHFTINTDPNIYEFSDIDVLPDNGLGSGEAVDYFELFEFSAKYDPVPTMLTQNHENPVKGYMGQTTEYNRDLVKDNVLIMGENRKRNTVKYMHGNLGEGTFTFLGGHDPEDYRHLVGDPPTQLFLKKNSPGYRLILNNVLFPGAKPKELKT